MRPVRAAGFTLVEVLVSLALFALISGVAYRGLSAVLDTRARLEEETSKWRDLSTAFALFGQAVGSSIDRPARDERNRISASFTGVETPPRAGDTLVEFTRTGLPGRSGALADLQRVGFALNDGRLVQYHWPVLDRAPRSHPSTTTLMEGVQEARVRFLDRQGGWHAAWPLPDRDEPLPAAVGLTVRLAGGEQLTRFFALP